MLNRWDGMGRLTKDPVIRTITGGKKVASFTLAVDRGKSVDFINCVCWDKLAETAEKHLTKGKLIVVSGRLSFRTWKDKEERTREETEIVVYELNFTGDNRKPREQFAEMDDSEEGDLPF